MTINKDRVEELALAKERQLLEVKRSRKDADEKLQSMLNRINFLKSEEAKFDREIENARKRTRDLLARKAEKAERSKDEDLLSTAKDILGALGPSISEKKPLRPNTGRSSLGSLNNSQSISSAAAALIHQSIAVSAASPSKSSSAGQVGNLRPGSSKQQRLVSSGGKPLKPTLSSDKPTASSAINHTKRNRSSSSSTSSSQHSSPSAERPPIPKTSERVPSPANITRFTKNSGDGSSMSSSSQAQNAIRAESPTTASSNPSDLFNVVPSSSIISPNSDGNKMDMLSAHNNVDQELIEELIAGGSNSSHFGEERLQGLHQFSTEAAGKVVEVRAARRQDSSSTGSVAMVVAAGVGWGLAGNPASVSSVPLMVNEAVDQNRLKQELVKKRQIRTVRKAFGLEPTPLHDSSAQVIEIGAGAWQ
ncbi:hypothetical protein CEUSTIGMA_g1316.t1 [Chlamydomonas eustigma]|uniref:Uncharacterized protein n=1 Tax=Chlamydomonas eustigma TaxID=1157962 RepID=A0A250WSZ3_9CHLO|nr:hypothetical protein CEUSTIGMA_g1316.t1 [Chlamydomonas eustigma]|eukprot:GAX73866.1 hypothetical protein CEUSTIGMA_g1316.t1 [Chlamydomonas eustigma]